MTQNCSRCGAQLVPGERFCRNCGMPCDTPAPQKPKGNGALIGILAGVVLALLAGGGGLMFWSMQNQDTGVHRSAKSSDRDEDEEKTDKKTKAAGAADDEKEAGDAAEALEELLDIMNETSDFLGNLDGESYASVEKMKEVTEALAEQRSRAEAVKGLPENIRLAGDEFYDSLFYGMTPIEDMLTLAENFEASGVAEAGEAAEGAGYEELYESLQEIEALFDGISVPEYLNEGWKRITTTFTRFEDVLDKMYVGEQLEDSLRSQAGGNMANRLLLKINAELEDMMNIIVDDGLKILDRNLTQSMDLLKELESLKGKSSEELETVQIKSYQDPQTVSFTYKPVSTIYPSLYGALDQILYISASSLCEKREVLIEAEIPGFTQKYSQTFTVSPQLTPLYIKPPLLTGDLNLSSAKDAQIVVSISGLDGTKIESKSFPLRLMSKYDIQWVDEVYGDNAQDHILCFLTPEDTKITELKRGAADCVNEITGGALDGFIGYQGADEDDFLSQFVITYAQAAGLMAAMSEMGVRYNNDLFSMSGDDALQRVMLPADVLTNRSGLCIETSLTVASALQSAGMHAMLVFPPGHAQVAVEVFEGTGEYLLIETTELPNSMAGMAEYMRWSIDEEADYDIEADTPVTYMNKERWAEYLSDCYVLDCDDSVTFGLTALTN